jgi:hypothetical protein
VYSSGLEKDVSTSEMLYKMSLTFDSGRLRQSTTFYDNLRQSTTTYDILRQPTTFYDNLRHSTTTYGILRQVYDILRQPTTRLRHLRLRHLRGFFETFASIRLLLTLTTSKIGSPKPMAYCRVTQTASKAALCLATPCWNNPPRQS